MAPIAHAVDDVPAGPLCILPSVKHEQVEARTTRLPPPAAAAGTFDLHLRCRLGAPRSRMDPAKSDRNRPNERDGDANQAERFWSVCGRILFHRRCRALANAAGLRGSFRCSLGQDRSDDRSEASLHGSAPNRKETLSRGRRGSHGGGPAARCGGVRAARVAKLGVLVACERGARAALWTAPRHASRDTKTPRPWAGASVGSSIDRAQRSVAFAER